MINFPLFEDLNLISDVKNIVPIDVPIMAPDVEEFTEEQRNTLTKYFSYVFPYNDIYSISGELDRIVKSFNMYDVIIAPGDSPSIFINPIKYLDLYKGTIITFPISGLGEEVECPLDKLVEYLKYVIEDHYKLETLSGLEIGYFDYSSSGDTRKCIETVLKHLYDNIKIKSIPFTGEEETRSLAIAVNRSENPSDF